MSGISIPNTIQHLKQTVWRFPLAVLFSFAYFMVLVFAINKGFDRYFYDHILRFSFALPLGFVLSVGCGLLSEDTGGGWRNIAGWLVIPLMAVYFMATPQHENTYIILRHLLFCIVAVLFLCIAPVNTTKPAYNLWQYNVRIWLRFALSVIFSGIFLGGFSLAVFAVGYLFNLEINDNAYGYLAAFFFSVFAPFFYMAGLPDKESITGSGDFKISFLRILGQYVLLPILATYLVILYVYGLKILFSWELPNGWVSSLVLAYAGGGIFTYFLLHNLYLDGTSKIAAFFGKYFFPSVIPLLLLLFIAILRRLCDYGFTEERYFVFVAALWLTGITACMIITKGRSFRPVIISLALVTLLSAIGPWCAFNVSGKSQVKRLTTLLSANQLLENGKWIQHEPVIAVPDSVYHDIGSIVIYFTQNQMDRRFLYPLLETVHSELEQADYWSRKNILMKYLRPLNDESSQYFSVKSPGLANESLLIRGYDVVLGTHYDQWSNREEMSHKDSTAAYALHVDKSLNMCLYKSGVLHQSYQLRPILDSLMNKIAYGDRQYATIERNRMTFSDNHSLILFTDISGEQSKDSIQYQNIEILMLWKD